MNDSLNKKTQLRKDMSKKRENLHVEDVKKLSEQICTRLYELHPLKGAKSIMGFVPIRNEVNLMPFLEQQMKSGKTILLPRVEDNGEMLAVEFKGWDKTKISSYGIAEPVGEPYPEDKIDVVLVPGLVFDGNGYRLGYGKGYYDRFLPRLKNNAFKCGSCYDFQIVEDVFPHEKDIPVQWILTDKSELGIDWDYF